MDAGSSSTVRGRSRIGYRPLHPFLPINGNPRPYRHNAERYIPNRSAMDFGFARYQLTQSAPDKERENEATESDSPSSKDAYRKCLAKALGMDRTRILAFRNKPPPYAEQCSSPPAMKHRKRQRSIPRKPERTLDLPGFLDDFYLNLLDWGSKGVLSIALEDTVYLWSNANGGSTSELVTVDQESGPVTSVCWAPDGERIAVGLTSSDIQLWDSQSNRLLRTLRGAHESRVLSLCWNGSILTSGGEDGKIVNRDVRTRSQVIQRCQGHRGEVCGLKWSSSGEQLASGGNDRLIYIWNLSMSSSRPQNQNQWLHRFEDHTSAVKALAWCPFQRNLLTSGGGDNDRCIKFWNTSTGACLNSVQTSSQVCSVLWNKNGRELLSSHGFTDNHLALWKYPSMTKMAELTGHTSRVLHMAPSPDGSMVASAAADESLRFWRVFGDHDTPKPAANPTGSEASGNFSRYFIR
ncbi:uncharacterized protein A4U43_C02F13250 [Asparagus officinalis]|uniref:CDC20/Fizzy WD40 domain-containing protein n=1 Tax=Asparagus officinalis TaxID=4686 RepID=A0A5P1FM18_ASPOF|nr:cell division cycle 20.2, cofactor of APC complex-like [Asparagus officinalis]ONK78009.1 uncharacterized protein A4U43_C02F13250 [Asparagus officinalis]